MIAPARLPPRYAEWNAAVGAPGGRRVRGGRWLKRLLGEAAFARVAGPFALQRNNSTRAFEYPWAFEALRPAPGLEVLEIGGGLSGLQFSLARAGCQVTNVDPGGGGEGERAFGAADVERFNRVFRTGVRYVPARISGAALDASRFDRVVALSVLEHLEPDEAKAAMRAAFEALRPAGLCVLTVDLFLNLHPFTRRLSNRYGSNLDVRELVEASGMRLVSGLREQLHGYPQFDPEAVLSRLEDFWVGGYPALAQCLVLEKQGPGRTT
jgi:SAM-dependent methyltransferase